MSCSESTLKTPKFGIFVVNGYGAIFGRAFVKAVSKEDFPAFGKPTRPTSAIMLSSNFKIRFSPGFPSCAYLGA